MATMIPCGGFEIDNDSFEFSNGVLKAKAQEPSGGTFLVKIVGTYDDVEAKYDYEADATFEELVTAMQEDKILVAQVTLSDDSTSNMYYFDKASISDPIGEYDYITFFKTSVAGDGGQTQTALYEILSDDSIVPNVLTAGSNGGDNGGGSTPA